MTVKKAKRPKQDAVWPSTRYSGREGARLVDARTGDRLISPLAAEEIACWLTDLDVSVVARNTLRRRTSAVFSFAKAKKRLAENAFVGGTKSEIGVIDERRKKWTEDITRHTFGSNHLAHHADSGVTAIQLSNSREVQRYLALVKPVLEANDHSVQTHLCFELEGSV